MLTPLSKANGLQYPTHNNWDGIAPWSDQRVSFLEKSPFLLPWSWPWGISLDPWSQFWELCSLPKLLKMHFKRPITEQFIANIYRTPGAISTHPSHQARRGRTRHQVEVTCPDQPLTSHRSLCSFPKYEKRSFRFWCELLNLWFQIAQNKMDLSFIHSFELMWILQLRRLSLCRRSLRRTWLLDQIPLMISFVIWSGWFSISQQLSEPISKINTHPNLSGTYWGELANRSFLSLLAALLSRPPASGFCPRQSYRCVESTSGSDPSGITW